MVRVTIVLLQGYLSSAGPRAGESQQQQFQLRKNLSGNNEVGWPYFWRDTIFTYLPCSVLLLWHREESGLAPAIRSVYKLERAYCYMLAAHEEPQLLLYSYTVV